MQDSPPIAPQKQQELTAHGDIRIDPWYWIQNMEDPDTLEYLNSENSFTEHIFEPWAEQRERLFTEMRARIKEDDSTVPSKEGDYWYYTKFEEGTQYPIFCRKYLSLDKPEEILLDVNQLAENQDYTQIGSVENSPDHKLLAFSVDYTGSEEYTIRIKDLETGFMLDDSIPNSYYSLEWANDSRTIFYDSLDEHHRPVKIHRHLIGTDFSSDVLIYQETDPRFFVGLTKSASSRFIYVISGGNNITEWHFLDANQPNNSLTLIQPRQDDFEYDVEDHGEHFMIRNNGDGAKDFKISQTPIANPLKENWTDFYHYQPGRIIQTILLFKDYLVVSIRDKGLPKLEVIHLDSGTNQSIYFDEEDYNVRPQQGREWNTSVLRFSYASLTTPSTIFDYDMANNSRELKKQTEVLAGFDSNLYASKRVLAPAEDGTLIPISLLFRKDTPLDGSAPLYLYGYGSYGIIMESDFGWSRLSLVDRGFIFAIAHPRGGMDLGWDWYQEGKLLNKKNTFTDFIQCAEYLIQEKYTQAGQIVAVGGSAGGMLMGAIANMRPDLFRSIVAHVPFVDVLTTMLDDTLPLTTMEYNEWGNPNQHEYYNYIKSYSPYDNILQQDYPSMFITGGISDPRVTYWEPTKWAASLRHNKTDNNLLLLKIHMDSGHAGASGRFERLKEVAEEYTFILNQFGYSED